MKDTRKAKEEFEKAFGPISELDGAKIWWIIKAMKHARLRCRNNSALNNWLNSVFGNKFRFSQENKQRPSRYSPSVMETYQGLVIRDKNNEKVTSQDEGEEE